MSVNKFGNYRIILASTSPRRQQLMKDAGIPYEVVIAKDIDEKYPGHLSKTRIPVFLAQRKARAVSSMIKGNTVIIGADTIVWLKNRVINKPTNEQDAFNILSALSGQMHEVLTGVCLLSSHREMAFYEKSRVYFNRLSSEQILYYIRTFKPFDKAGAYGIQEWIGYIGIKKIEGSFYNVMGLPVDRVYRELIKITDI